MRLFGVIYIGLPTDKLTFLFLMKLIYRVLNLPLMTVLCQQRGIHKPVWIVRGIRYESLMNRVSERNLKKMYWKI